MQQIRVTAIVSKIHEIIYANNRPTKKEQNNYPGFQILLFRTEIRVNYLFSVDGDTKRNRISCRIGQAHDRALIAAITAGSRWCRCVSSNVPGSTKTMKNNRIFGAVGNMYWEIYEIQFRLQYIYNKVRIGFRGKGAGKLSSTK